jgi:hypothetical protein
MLRQFDPDAGRLAVLRQCTENYDIGDPGAEWQNNILSRKLVVYGSGRIAREGEPARHNVDPEELALCRRLAAEAADVMAGVEVGMGSEAGDPFRPFYIAANADDLAPEAIDEALIRSMFAGTIFPPATITVEPLAEAGRWWQEVEGDASRSRASRSPSGSGASTPPTLSIAAARPWPHLGEQGRVRAILFRTDLD